MKKPAKSSRNIAKGFTLVELMVSMAIFLLISGVAFRLFSLQQNSASILRDQVGLNLALRNAVTELQLDISNAGSGYFQGLNVPGWPVGVTIMNNVVASGSSCYNSTTGAYGSTCFDTVNVIAAANPTNYPPVNTTDSSGSNGASNCSYTNTGVAYTQAAVVNGTPWTLASTAAEFKSGDQLLLVTSSSTATLMTTVVLTADASVAGGKAVKLTFNSTNTDGTNTYGSHDPLDITTCHGDSPCPAASQLTTQFCGTDWAIKLAPITYLVCAGPGSSTTWCTDTSSSSPDIKDPKLVRVQSGTANVIMDQVIGFRLAASIFNTVGDNSTSYQYNSACYTASPTFVVGTNLVPTSPGCANDEAYNFTVVRSVRASLIARTTPNYNANYTFRNTFDGGPYQVEGTTVVVDPRNMSMND